MPTNLTIVLENRPGSVGVACEAIGRAGINIEGLCAFASQGIGILHVTVNDATGAGRAVEAAGLKVSEQREVLVVDIEDQPGSAARILSRIGGHGINIDLVYLATATRLVIGSSELEKARGVLHRV